MTELGLQKMEKVQNGPKSTSNTEQNTKSVTPQIEAHNLQNVPNGMTRTIRFSDRNFQFSL